MDGVITITEEDALREALNYIAHCLERQEIYDVATDEFIQGDIVRIRLIEFARKIAENKSPNWKKWIQLKHDREKKQIL